MRDYSSDNIRFLLIFFVVFGHLLEYTVPLEGIRLLYQVIYSFHMPAFIFLFGYYVKYSLKRIMFSWVIPYFIFQTLYTFFANNVLGENVPLKYDIPYWILWYLLVCIVYQLMLPIYNVTGKRSQVCVLIVSFVLSLIIGFDDYIEVYMSLSRFFVFQPWFLLGVYCRKNAVLDKLSVFSKTHRIFRIISVGMVCLSIASLCRVQIPNEVLYGSYPYSFTDSTVWMRMITILMAFCWIVFIFVLVKPCFGKRVILITSIGQNTLPIFLIHGLIVRSMAAFCPGFLDSYWKVFLISVAILILFGNKFCKIVVNNICFCWLEQRISGNVK